MVWIIKDDFYRPTSTHYGCMGADILYEIIFDWDTESSYILRRKRYGKKIGLGSIGELKLLAEKDLRQTKITKILNSDMV